MKKAIAISILAAVAASAYAKPLSPQQALERVAVTDASSGRMAVRAVYKPSPIFTMQSTSGSPAVYLFESRHGEGFMVVSADDVATPLLGYCDSGSLDPSNLPPQFVWWLEGYAAQIGEASSAGLDDAGLKYRSATAYNDGWAPIAPMLKTRWDQTYPYNAMCPMIGNRRCVTGCVATAMAQVMKYWNYPERGMGSISYVDSELGTLSMDFDVAFDWDNMLDTYGFNNPQENIDAVALLMKACGYSIQMDYGVGASGTMTNLVATAMRDNFGYDNEISRRERSEFLMRDEAWNTLVYNQLKTVGPVVYSGVVPGATVGHCFVCDGYDGNGFFHINWGWSGMADGYFKLEALNPSSQGTGGTAGGYNTYQTIITGCQPPVGRMTSTEAWIENAASDSGNVQGKGYIYRINDPSNIVLKMKCKATGGYLSTPVSVRVTDNGTTVMQKDFEERVMLENGQSGEYTTVLSIADFDPSAIYTATLLYQLNGESKAFTSLKFAAGSGVAEIAADGSGRWIVYNLQGIRLLDTTDPEAVNELPAGIYIVNGKLYRHHP